MTKSILFSILAILFAVYTSVVCIGASDFQFETDQAKYIIRLDLDEDGEEGEQLVSLSLGIAHRTKGEDAGFHWLSLTGTAYTGGNIWFQGEYEVKAEIVPFFSFQSGSFEGPIQANQEKVMNLSILPPPQNEDMPNIGRCNANSEIKGEGLKAKTKI